MDFLSRDPHSVLCPHDLVAASTDGKGAKPEDLFLERLAVVTFTRPDLEEVIRHGGKEGRKGEVRIWGSGRNRIFRGEGWVALESRFGAPNVVILLEEMAAFGVERVIFLGYCGSLQENACIGDLVLADRALREEGTSYHYLEEGEAALPDLRLQGRLHALFRTPTSRIHRGSIWTTDAPYRETREKVARYRKDGILGVEMEMSAAFVVGMVKNDLRRRAPPGLRSTEGERLETGFFFR